MLKVTEVVKHLLIVNVLVFVIAQTPFMAPYFSKLLIYPPPTFEPYQLISHMFMHANVNHILMNMLGLFFLGPTVESRLGSKNFFILYFACGLAGAALPLFLHMTGLAHMAPSLGASGATVGVSVAFATLLPDTKLQLMFIPVPIKAKFLIGAFVLFDIVAGIGNVVGVMKTNIGHFAHLGGAIAAFLLVTYYFRRIIHRR